MVPRRVLTALILSLVCSALFTLWLGKTFFKPARAGGGNQRFVAATSNLEPGAILVASNLKVIDWPASIPVEGAFTKPTDLAGRTLIAPLSAGQPIIERDLAASGAASGLSTRIPDGMRAISLKTDQVVGVAGFLLPGTRVDVLVTYRTPTSPSPVTSTVLQDAQILAAGQKMQADPDGKPSTTDVVTLLVNPEDAERVVLASAQGSVHFVLRNGQDHIQRDDSPAQISELGSIGEVKTPVKSIVPVAAAAVVQPPVRKPYTVQTMAGGKTTVETFQ